MVHNKNVQRFDRNTRGRDLVVGDIHGTFSKLKAALSSLDFDPARGDRLFSVGDLVDRGPESEQYTDWLDAPWFHPVRGNHEELAIQLVAETLDLELYLRVGGAWNMYRSPALQKAAAEAFAALPVAIELETAEGPVGIVHADVPVRSWKLFIDALERGDPEHAAYAQWSRARLKHLNEAVVEDIRAVIVGHTPIDEPLTLGNVIHIDTGAWMGESGSERSFTLLDVRTLKPATAPCSGKSG